MASEYVGLACLPLAASHRALYVLRHCSTHLELGFLMGVLDRGTRRSLVADLLTRMGVLSRPWRVSRWESRWESRWDSRWEPW